MFSSKGICKSTAIFDDIDNDRKCLSNRIHLCQSALQGLSGEAFIPGFHCTCYNRVRRHQQSMHDCVRIRNHFRNHPCRKPLIGMFVYNAFYNSKSLIKSFTENTYKNYINESHQARNDIGRHRRHKITSAGGYADDHNTCSVLYKKCQQHVACRQLWDLYMKQCPVQNDVCKMTNKFVFTNKIYIIKNKLIYVYF